MAMKPSQVDAERLLHDDGGSPDASFPLAVRMPESGGVIRCPRTRTEFRSRRRHSRRPTRDEAAAHPLLSLRRGRTPPAARHIRRSPTPPPSVLAAAWALRRPPRHRRRSARTVGQHMLVGDLTARGGQVRQVLGQQHDRIGASPRHLSSAPSRAGPETDQHSVELRGHGGVVAVGAGTARSPVGVRRVSSSSTRRTSTSQMRRR